MFRSIVFSSFIIVVSSFPGCEESCDQYSPTSPSNGISADNIGNIENLISGVKDVVGDLFSPQSASGVPDRFNGFELLTIHGWFAIMYPGVYDPTESTVHPVARLWTPGQTPSPFQVMEQCRQIKDFGGGAVVLEYSPNPALGWHNYWLSNNFASECGPFFLLYEHINGTRFVPASDGPKNMDDPYNRKVFREDIKFIWENVIWDPLAERERFPGRYVTVDGRAVIYMWSTSIMVGDFGSLLEEVKKEYPVMFIGSGGEIWSTPTSSEGIARVEALDGFMEYTLGGRDNYLRATRDYHGASDNWSRYLRNIELKTGKHYVFIPTFQAASDDTKASGRNNPPMYPHSLKDLEDHVESIRVGMTSGLYSPVGPFVVYSELPEGAAVIESQCLPETIDRPGRYVGCGTKRLEILKKYFGR